MSSVWLHTSALEECNRGASSHNSGEMSGKKTIKGVTAYAEQPKLVAVQGFEPRTLRI